jgi:glycosyltransferase involved in cell wall biosynthesis
LTAGATVFVYPSLYEGFGFPVAQAMAAGVPVITSNVSSLPEITAGAAILIDPHSSSDLATSIGRTLITPSLRAELSEAGRRTARRYTWRNAAIQSVAFFSNL